MPSIAAEYRPLARWVKWAMFGMLKGVDPSHQCFTSLSLYLSLYRFKLASLLGLGRMKDGVLCD